MPVQIPDDSDFSSFKEQCESQEGWIARYNKGSVTVWCRAEESKGVQKLKASGFLYPSLLSASLSMRKGKALHCGVLTTRSEVGDRLIMCQNAVIMNNVYVLGP